MVSSIDASVSGLAAAAKRIEASARNIANQSSTRTKNIDGNVENKPYTPQVVDQVSLSTGGVQATLRDAQRPPVPVYNPSDVAADARGIVQTPNIDTAQEMVNIKLAAQEYKANLKAIKAQDDMQQRLLDILG